MQHGTFYQHSIKLVWTKGPFLRTNWLALCLLKFQRWLRYRHCAPFFCPYTFSQAFIWIKTLGWHATWHLFSTCSQTCLNTRFLNDNQLSGPIPAQISELTALQLLCAFVYMKTSPQHMFSLDKKLGCRAIWHLLSTCIGLVTCSITPFININEKVYNVDNLVPTA